MVLGSAAGSMAALNEGDRAAYDSELSAAVSNDWA